MRANIALQLLEELTLQRLDELNVDSLITVMCAFARSSYLPDVRIQDRMAAATEADMASFTPRQLEHAAWSLAHVGYTPTGTWRENFAQALEVNWDYFRPEQLASTMVEAAGCGLTALTRTTLLTQLPATLRKATAPDSYAAPGMVAKLVWSAGHFGCAVHDSNASIAGYGTQSAAAPGSGAISTTIPFVPPPTSVDGSPTGPRATHGSPWKVGLAPADEEQLLAWWDGAGVIRDAEPAELVLLLCGFARLGVRPAAGLTARLLGALLGPPTSALSQLDFGALAALAWSTLKLAEPPLRPAWLTELQAALLGRLREAGMADGGAPACAVHSAGPEAELAKPRGVGAAGGTYPAAAAALRPADVALALSSLAGLGAYVGGGEELARYWRGPGRWEALAQEDRTVMAMLGYGPGRGT
ncbi:hypothetical protein GPECTOR_61g827 [Gonium pectorale]|uniref:Uncharacterized protein n=1 Tax=Gonium pectorale TaxID=33097 RepID=A0A150G4X9_GONPE|nr:hypothetical protein GPECTOR_61g827 [Gonium pectorale]|eukprot:KXZ44874.1 hypothetical protein GPECTOR_61g827 [Gonium pectorale]